MPIERKIGIPEATILSYVDRDKLAEVVDVQLYEVFQTALILRSGLK